MTTRIGIITNNQHGVFQQNVIAGAQAIAARFGYQVVVDSRDEADLNTPTTLDLDALSGVLVIANPVSDSFIQSIHHSGKPVSLVSHQIAGIPGVVSNNSEGIAKLVQHLVQECGRRQFVFINGNLAQKDGVERQHVFRQELMRYNLPDADFLDGDFEPEIAMQSLHAFLAETPPFDALVAADYLMARAALGVLADYGYRVPAEVSVVGFGDGVEAAEVGLTTVAADVIELGKRSIRQLIGQIQGLSIVGTTVLSVDLIIRETSMNPSRERGV